MADASTLAPYIDAIKPVIDQILPYAIAGLVAYAVRILDKVAAKYFDKATADQIAAAAQAMSGKITAAAQTQAGILVAKAEDNLAGKSITAHDAQVLDAAAFVVKILKPELDASGLSLDDMAHLIAAEIGKLQAQAPTVVTPAPTVVTTPSAPTYVWPADKK
jgi:hypothetical protein